MTNTLPAPADMTRKLRAAGVSVTTVGRANYRDVAISYYLLSDYSAIEFAKDVEAKTEFKTLRRNGHVAVLIGEH